MLLREKVKNSKLDNFSAHGLMCFAAFTLKMP